MSSCSQMSEKIILQNQTTLSYHKFLDLESNFLLLASHFLSLHFFDDENSLTLGTTQGNCSGISLRLR